MQLERQRDNQQWILDHFVKTAGRVQNFFDDGRALPAEVKSYAMIPRVLEKEAAHAEAIGRAAEEAGHYRTARDAYWVAADTYREAQHAIFEDDNPLKMRLWAKVDACYDRSHRAQRLPDRARGDSLAGRHARRAGAPATRPLQGALRHLHSWDGRDEGERHRSDEQHLPCPGISRAGPRRPGQGSSNLRKIRVTEDNYASAGSAAIDYVLQRPELDADKVVLFGSSMGTYWGSQIAATDPRVRGCATVRACYGPKQHIFNQASPRFKQVFMYMAGIHDEAAFDRLAARMTLDAYAPRIQCPTLMVTGEYDPLCYLDETEAVYEAIPGPRSCGSSRTRRTACAA